MIILIAFYMTISFANCQYKDYQCASVIKDVQNKCTKSYTCNVADSLLLKADYYMENPPDERCLNHYHYFVVLSDFYKSVLDSRNCSTEQVIYALDNAIELILKAGELKPEWLKKNGEGAEKLIHLYSIKSKIYFELEDRRHYDRAVEQVKYWERVYTGPVKQIDHTIPQNTTASAKKNTLHLEPIVSHPVKKKFVSRSIVVLTPIRTINKKSEFLFLTNEHLSIQFDSDIQIIPSDNPSRYKYKLLFEENVKHLVTVSYPGYEEQFFEFISTQVPQYDSLFVVMHPLETPLYYTKWEKRVFQPDSFSIVIIRNQYGSKEAFETLLEELDLKPSSSNAILFYKKSGEGFNQKEDSVIAKLRLEKSMVEVAGANLGMHDRINILTNQLRIVWKKKAGERTWEEQTQVDSLLQKYQLKEIEEDLYEAPIGIGLYLNTIAEELNQLSIVHLSYPETHQLIK